MAKHSYQVKLIRSTPVRLSPHPDSPTPEKWEKWARSRRRSLAVDLFSGGGGLSLGLEQAGYCVALAVDHDDWAVETHRHNIEGNALKLDLGDPVRVSELISTLKKLQIDLIAAGPPCQPFSRAGRSKIRSLVQQGLREQADTRAQLWKSFIEIVQQTKPTAALMENVPDMALGDDLATVREITSKLQSSGYDVHTRLLEAWQFGVPQHRQRFFLVALRDGRPFKWPDVSEEPVTLRDAIGDLPKLGDTTGLSEMSAGPAQSGFQEKARLGMVGDSHLLWDHVTRPVREDDREAFQLMKPGTRYGDLPARYRRYRSDIFNDKYNRLGWDSLSRSITAHIAKDGYWYIHPSEARTLTVREAARIQTFPDRFRFAGTRSSAFRQIGNAVPPALAEAIGEQILVALKSEPLPVKQTRSHRFLEIRASLLGWAEKNRAQYPWHHNGELWPAMVGAVLTPRTVNEDDFVAGLLSRFRSPDEVDECRLLSLGHSAGRRMAQGLPVLMEVTRRFQETSAHDFSWIEKCGLSTVQELRLRAIAAGENMILASTQALRVVERVFGLHQDGGSRSDKKLRLGDVVGTGSDVPKLNGALTALGTILCTASKPDCRQCPLQDLCVSAHQL